MKKKAINYEQSCALIIMTAHEMGYEVTMLSEAEGVIKDKRSIEPFSILSFEKASCEAHEKVRLDGVDAVVKANRICEGIMERHNV
jgi:hypothetical protein